MASEDTQILQNEIQKLTEMFSKTGEEIKKTPEEIKKLAKVSVDADARKAQADADQEARDLEQKTRDEEVEKKWDGLLGHFTWARKFQERMAKSAKAAKDSVVDFGKAKIKSVQAFAGNLMDILKKGLGLAAIWALFEFLKGDGAQMFWAVFDFVGEVVDWFVLLFTDPVKALKQLWDGMVSGAASIGAWIWDNTFVPLWTWFKETFPGAATVIEKLWAGLTGLAGNIGTWFWENAIKPVWEWLQLLWDDPMAALEQLATGVMNLGTWLWNNAIKPFWEWIQLLFTDPKLALAQFLQGYVNVGTWIYDKAIKPLWDWFEEQFPDAAAFIKNAWAAFMSSPIGEWIYNEVLEPFTRWLDTLFTDPTLAIDQMFTFFEDFGTWIFNRILQPLWDWIKLLFTDPTVAIKQMWTFFDDVGTWVFDMVLKPLWDWFEGMFPDVAASIKALWAEFTGGGDSILGKIGTFMKGIWDWFKGLFVFDDVGGAIASYLNFVFLPFNLVSKLITSVWNYIKGIFGFKEDEAKLDENFSVGGFIKEKLIDPIIEFLNSIINFDFSKLAKSVMPGALYDFIFGDSDAIPEGMSKEDLSKRADELKGIIDEGTGMTNWSVEDEKKELASIEAKLAKMALGGTMVNGGAAIVGEKGPELVVSTTPAKVIPAQQTADLVNGGGQSMVNAPTNTVINNSGSTSMMMGSSSEDKSNWKYGMQGA